MKNFAFLIILFSSFCFAQKQESDSVMAFSIGSKLILEMQTKDNIHFIYKVKKYEEFHEIVVYFNSEKIFQETPQENTIEVIFCYGKPFEKSTQEDYKTVMLLRNNTKIPLSYEALIKLPDKDGFNNTSTSPLFSGTRNSELWPYPIEAIALLNFTKYEAK